MQGRLEPEGRTVEALGLCLAEKECREQGHVVARAELPRSDSDPTSGHDICVTCTEQAGRLEGLRLWHSVCPCCFSSAFPGGMPLPHGHGQVARAEPPPTKLIAPAPLAGIPVPPAGGAVRVEVDGTPVAVFNIAGTIYAIGAVCPHEGGPLDEGEVEDGRVTCPWHGSVFDLNSGKVLTPPARTDVPSYEVRVSGNMLTLTLRTQVE
ncbi:MAG TPA: non-heme iron oxygenase ferredoxin subunit [Thermoplasmata archaeon]|nr:non-heme iron oxygenase ferredoxin subunit [Thermoplasmata archaeon]